LLATLTFGRSKIWQIIILVVAIGFGYGALYSLPRMGELENSRDDPAIQGRIAAFSYGLHLMRTNWYGIGLGNFKESFLREGPLEKEEVVKIIPPRRPNGIQDEAALKDQNPIRRRIAVWNHYFKATHSSYNENGAELGYTGLFLFVGLLYCCVRTLVLMKCENTEEERVRRALFAMVVAYAVSSWMVDFCYRPTFFLFIAAISGLHRHFLRKQEEAQQPAPGEVPSTIPPWLRRPPLINIPAITLPGLPIPIVAGPAASVPLASSPLEAAMPARLASMGGSGRAFPWQKQPEQAEEKKPRIPKFLWNRLGLLDLLFMLALTYVAIRYWEHLIATF
jgi:hypothetical protein